MHKRTPTHHDVREKNSLLEQAMHEVRRLRRDNELMHARLDVFDTLTSFLHARVPEGGSMLGLDIAWAIDRHLQVEKDLELKQEEPFPTANVNQVPIDDSGD